MLLLLNRIYHYCLNCSITKLNLLKVKYLSTINQKKVDLFSLKSKLCESLITSIHNYNNKITMIE